MLCAMATRRCPRCKLINPRGTAVCDCGWSFVDEEMSEPRLLDDRREGEARSELRSRGINQLLLGGLLLLAGIGVTMATYDNASVSGGTYVIAYGPIVFGLIAIVRGLLGLSSGARASDGPLLLHVLSRETAPAQASASALPRDGLESFVLEASRVRCFTPMDRELLYETANRDDLAALAVALRTAPASDERWYCMCIGTLVFTFEAPQPRSITLHHGESLRWEGSEGNIALVDPDAAMGWLSARGMGFVREQYDRDRRRSDAGAALARRWRAALPASLVPFFDRSLGESDDGGPKPAAALEAELPDPVERARVLLDLFGSGAGPWSGYPAYEALPAQLLLDLPLDVLLAAIGDTPDERRREGAARLFSSWDFHQRREPDIAKLPDALRRQLLAHAEASTDEDKRARARAALGSPTTG